MKPGNAATPSPISIRPKRNPHDAMLDIEMSIGDAKFDITIKIPGLAGNIPQSRHHKQAMSEMIVKALRTEFGPRTEAI